MLHSDKILQGHGSMTDHSPSPAHESGTVCWLHCGP